MQPSHIALPLGWYSISYPTDGRRLNWLERLVTYQDGNLRATTHFSTNRTGRSVTSLMRRTTLPLGQAIKGSHKIDHRSSNGEY